jgi:hypothetical protein
MSLSLTKTKVLMGNNVITDAKEMRLQGCGLVVNGSG